MNSMILVELSIVLAALAWKGQRFRMARARSLIPVSGVRWTIVLAIVALSLTVLQLFPGSGDPAELAGHVAQFLHNVTLIGTFVALQLLYLGYQPEDGRWRSGRGEVQVAASVLFVMAIVTMWAMITRSGLRFNQYDLKQPIVAAYFILPTLYILYAEATQIYYSLHYAIRYRSWIQSSALMVTATGMAMLLVPTGLRAWLVVTSVTGHQFSVSGHALASSLITIGNATVAAGLVLPIPAAAALAVLNRRRAFVLYRDLEPLWLLIRYVFPELIRPHTPAGRLTTVDASGISTKVRGGDERPTAEFLATSRRTECRGGFQLLSPYLSGTEEVPPQSRIARAQEELAAIWPLSTGIPGSPALDERRAAWWADTRQLVALSRALRSRDLRWCTMCPDSDSEELV